METKQKNAIATREPSMMDLLSIAIEKNSAIDVIERLAALQRDTIQRQAEVEFIEALNNCQREIVTVAPDLYNKQTSSHYASYQAVDKTVRPVYTKYGISLSFNTEDCDKPDCVKVVCYVSKGAYTRKYQLVMPADGKGAKGGDAMTKTHATGSAMSYGMRYLLRSIFNVAVGEDDNDGNGATEPAPAKAVAQLRALIVEKGRDERKLCEMCRISKLEEISVEQFSDAMTTLARLPAKTTAPPAKKQDDQSVDDALKGMM